MAAQDDRRENAREVVREIVESHGCPPEEDWARLEPEMRKRWEKCFQKKDELAGASIITVANRIYSGKARFVFELIQNAEDCNYTKAKERGEAPFISFKVYPGRIIIDCNQDEFEDENVRALCNIGKSSKTSLPGYVGEKGIGFKSVFMVASRASIQSGPFSFYFKHKEGDLGIGMINPIWEEQPDREPYNHSTRITLILHDCEQPSETSKQYFKGLEKTILLFLKKLKRIELSFYQDEDILSYHTAYTSQYDEVSHQAIVTRTCLESGAKTKEESEHYHVTKKQVHGLPKHDNRTYTEKEGDERADATAEVVLAFQVDADSVPLIRNQKVSAFLPIKDFGFSFLIQSDFVTDVSREGIIEDSDRNIALLDGIAETFADAMEQLCNHEKMQYVWMKYLPSTPIAGDFWPKLVPKIKSCLSSADTKVLRTRRDHRLKSIGEVKRVASDFLDRHGNPLFEDLQEEVYITDEYSSQDLDTLSDFGLATMDFNVALARICADLESSTSRMKDPNTDDDWHSRAARFLSLPFEDDRKVPFKSAVRALRLVPLVVPLENSSWVSISDVKVKIHYSQVNGVLIPNDIGLHLLGLELAENSGRRKLFDYIGVTTASSSEVRNRILQKYDHNEKSCSYRPGLESSLAHLTYLYCTHETGASKIPGLCVYDHNGRLIIPSLHCIYLRTNERYGASELFRMITSNNGEVVAAGFEAPFLHPAYLESPPSQASCPLSWELWFQQYVRIRTTVPLTVWHSAIEELSQAFTYIMKYRPEMVLGAIQFGWPHYKEKLTRTAEDLLSDAEVLCEDRSKVPLCETFLPAPLLKMRITKFLTGDETFPFLQLPQPPKDESCQEWAFLTKFGVGMSDNLDFYLMMMDSILDANPLVRSVSDPLRIFQLYEAIQSQCWGSEEKEGQMKAVRDYFREKQAIYVPSRGLLEAAWAYPQDCLWEAPADFESKHPMNSLCKENVVRSNTNAAILKQFFQNTLEICDITWSDMFLELQALRSSGQRNVSRVRDLYRQLNAVRTTLKGSEANQIRDEFMKSKYIYVDSKGAWYMTKECLWSSEAEITGKVTISDQYEVLEDFFVKFLEVEAPNISMLVDELVGLGRRRASTDKVKAVVWAINSLLETEDNPLLTENLKDANVLPVILRDGLAELRNSKSNFSVIDRQKLADGFKGRAVMLDFNLTEVRNLQLFLTWLGLEERYLSRTVTEVSRFNGAPGVVVSKSDGELSCKAHALFRCAVHFRSPRVQGDDLSLYRLLCHAKVYQTDGISRHLNLLENDGTITESAPSNSRLYIDENGTELRVYVPKDTKERELCYLGTLPQRILDFIMTNPITLQRTNVEPGAITIIGNILKSSPYVVDDLLEDAGIIPYNIPVDDQPTEWENIREDIHRKGRSSVMYDSPSPSTLSRTSSTGSNISEPRTPRSSSSVSEPSTRATPSPSRKSISRHRYPNSTITASANDASTLDFVEEQHPLANTIQSDSQYKRLLDKIITASQTAMFPTQGVFNMGPLRHALAANTEFESLKSTEYPSAFGVRSENQMEHDRKIGAAGELFVFEILDRLFPTLPGYVQDVAFTLANWESKIREYAKVHHKYTEMRAWPGKMETSDITYDDKKGIFTRFLREKGYLQSEIWNNATPKYYLEVKTTTKGCDTRFFVSKAQYKLMRDCHNSNTKGEVYVIIRVFNLNKDNIDMRVYVDPAAMEERHELNFTAQQWSVVPGKGNNGAVVSQDS